MWTRNTGWVFLLLGLSTVTAAGAESISRGYAWARLGQGARAMAMGGAQVAIVNDTGALFWNPAGLAGPENRLATEAGYRKAVGSTHTGYAAGSWRVGRGAVGAAVAVLNHGRLDEITSTGEATGNAFTPYSASFAVAHGFSVGDGGEVGLGYAVRFYHQAIAEYASSAVGLDLGWIWERDRWSIGGSVRHLGVEVDPMVENKVGLPLTATLGGAWRSRVVPLRLALDLELPRDVDAVFHAGAEYGVTDRFAVRAGYTTLGRDQAIDPSVVDGFTAGFGLEWGSSSRVDYAFGFQGDLGVAHRLTVGYGGP